MKNSLAITFILFISLFCIEWQPVGPGGGGAMFVPAVSPHNPNLMFISCDMGAVYRSTNGGTSWHMINFRQLKNSIACPPVFHPVDSLTMWDDCYRNWRYYINISTDGGITFDEVFFCNSSWGDVPNLAHGWISLDYCCGWGLSR